MTGGLSMILVVRLNVQAMLANLGRYENHAVMSDIHHLCFSYPYPVA